jgi:hypothetical protein
LLSIDKKIKLLGSQLNKELLVSSFYLSCPRKSFHSTVYNPNTSEGDAECTVAQYEI